MQLEEPFFKNRGKKKRKRFSFSSRILLSDEEANKIVDYFKPLNYRRKKLHWWEDD